VKANRRCLIVRKALVDGSTTVAIQPHKIRNQPEHKLARYYIFRVGNSDLIVRISSKFSDAARVSDFIKQAQSLLKAVDFQPPKRL